MEVKDKSIKHEIQFFYFLSDTVSCLAGLYNRMCGGAWKLFYIQLGITIGVLIFCRVLFQV